MQNPIPRQFIHLHQSGLLNYFTQCITNHYFNYFDAQTAPGLDSRSPFKIASIFYVFLTYSYHLLSTCLFSGTIDVIGTLCTFLALEINHFPKELIPFNCKWYLNTKIAVLDVLISTEVLLLPGYLNGTELGNRHMVIYICIFFCIYIY